MAEVQGVPAPTEEQIDQLLQRFADGFSYQR